MLYRKTKYNETPHEEVNNFNLGPDGATLGAWPYIDNSHTPPFPESRRPGTVWGPSWHFNDPRIAVPPGRPTGTNNPLGPAVGNSKRLRGNISINRDLDGGNITEFKTADDEDLTNTKATEILLNRMNEFQNITYNLFFLIFILLFLIIIKLY